MSSQPVPISHPVDSNIHAVNSFWFDNPGSEPAKRWFFPNNVLDAEVRTKFGSLVEQARSNSLDSWQDTPEGSMALIILLDQFPRNIYRGSPLSFSSDTKACEVATKAVARGFDRQLSGFQQVFMYTVFTHAEDLRSQILCCSLLEGLRFRVEGGKASDAELEFVRMTGPFGGKHREVIMRFGRFPARNKALGRESTKEEEDFLKENPQGL